uniref:Uncharacterized protein n=1 Tax=Chromera velia CCMP2878 TaxID=1169474 RepID=A0A0G4HWI4_9ALVE|eukprot:Cvel_32666.t1-p1 / transcript=Cvel_32666.t1 / gene=Cvel_32666 / organism=Chromera_velia_CCMP2878 / gene_product=hypothetical protein / transcript_product=hypothetical protein / location=Cvel_scaffold5132:734-4932(+) / protein_length=675 / sequence_SO=supercontig / SO=protein_coding / is_pseudo=false
MPKLFLHGALSSKIKSSHFKTQLQRTRSEDPKGFRTPDETGPAQAKPPFMKGKLEADISATLEMLRAHGAGMSADITATETSALKTVNKKVQKLARPVLGRTKACQTNLTAIPFRESAIADKMLEIQHLLLLEEADIMGGYSGSNQMRDVDAFLSRIRSEVKAATLQHARPPEINPHQYTAFAAVKPNKEAAAAASSSSSTSAIQTSGPVVHAEGTSFSAPDQYRFPLAEEYGELVRHVTLSIDKVIAAHSLADGNSVSAAVVHKSASDVRQSAFETLDVLTRNFVALSRECRQQKTELEAAAVEQDRLKEELRVSEEGRKSLAAENTWLQEHRKPKGGNMPASSRLYALLGIGKLPTLESPAGGNTIGTMGATGGDPGPSLDDMTRAAAVLGVNPRSLPKYSEDFVDGILDELDTAAKKNEELMEILQGGGWTRQEVEGAGMGVGRKALAALRDRQREWGEKTVKSILAEGFASGNGPESRGVGTSSGSGPRPRNCPNCGTPSHFRGTRAVFPFSASGASQQWPQSRPTRLPTAAAGTGPQPRKSSFMIGGGVPHFAAGTATAGFFGDSDRRRVSRRDAPSTAGYTAAGEGLGPQESAVINLTGSAAQPGDRQTAAAAAAVDRRRSILKPPGGDTGTSRGGASRRTSTVAFGGTAPLSGVSPTRNTRLDSTVGI